MAHILKPSSKLNFVFQKASSTVHRTTILEKKLQNHDLYLQLNTVDQIFIFNTVKKNLNPKVKSFGKLFVPE